MGLSDHNRESEFPYHAQPQKNEWYEKTWLVIVLCIIIFPVGLYALWKNPTIGRGWQVAITTLVAIIVIAKLNSGNSIQETSGIATSTEKTDQKGTRVDNEDGTTESAVAEAASSEKDIIEKKLKDKASRDWPNDYTTQEFWVNQELEDYEYMLAIEDNAIKRQAERDWPLDFTTQKYWYNEQLEARERMK